MYMNLLPYAHKTSIFSPPKQTLIIKKKNLHTQAMYST